MIGAFKWHNFKHDHHLAVLISITEGHRKFDVAQGVRLSTRNHTMEFCGVVLELFLGKVHLLQSLQVHDIQASIIVHEALGEVKLIDAGTHNQSIALFWDGSTMIRPVEGARAFRPLDVLWHSQKRGVQDPEG
jgi:hypothetical protein